MNNKIGYLVLCGLTIASVLAEPPRYRFQQQRFGARQEVEPTTAEQDASDESITENSAAPYPAAGIRPNKAFNLPSDTEQQTPNDGAPYAPSGWKPAGRLLALPARQQQNPSTTYGAPQPPQEYGTPATDEEESTATESDVEASDASDSNETTDEPDSESVNVVDLPAQLINQQQQQGAYFVQLTDGSLQRVVYVTNSANNGVTAKLQVRPVAAAAAYQSQPLIVNPFLVQPQAISYSAQYQQW